MQQSSDFFSFTKNSLDSQELSLETQMQFRLLTGSELTNRIKSLCRKSNNKRTVANTFQERFESRFRLKEKGFPKRTVLIAKQLFSNLLASIEFHPSSSMQRFVYNRFYNGQRLVIWFRQIVSIMLCILRICTWLCDSFAFGMERNAGFYSSHFFDIRSSRSNAPY